MVGENVEVLFVQESPLVRNPVDVLASVPEPVGFLLTLVMLFCVGACSKSRQACWKADSACSSLIFVRSASWVNILRWFARKRTVPGVRGLQPLPRLPPLLFSPPLPSPLLSSPPLPSPHVLPPPGAIDEKHCSAHHGSSFEVTPQSLEEAAMAVAAWLLQPGEEGARKLP